MTDAAPRLPLVAAPEAVVEVVRPALGVLVLPVLALIGLLVGG